jgi:hypothetical protein
MVAKVGKAALAEQAVREAMAGLGPQEATARLVAAWLVMGEMAGKAVMRVREDAVVMPAQAAMAEREEPLQAFIHSMAPRQPPLI